jgi:hypothetical protein
MISHVSASTTTDAKLLYLHVYAVWHANSANVVMRKRDDSVRNLVFMEKRATTQNRKSMVYDPGLVHGIPPQCFP